MAHVEVSSLGGAPRREPPGRPGEAAGRRRGPLEARAIARALGNPPPTQEQSAIIEADPARPLLVVAGAGSGKTETMAARVVWLVANGHVDPDQVLGLTFTRKAATELAERVVRRLRTLEASGLWRPPRDDGSGADALLAIPTVSTYHSYAGRLVREHALRLGIEPESRLVSEAAAWQYAAEVVARYDGPMGEVASAESTIIDAVVSLAGELAEHLLSPADVDTYLDEFEARMAVVPQGPSRARSLPIGDTVKALRGRRAILPIVERYLALKRSRDTLDFADQMALAARLARDFSGVGAIERQRFGAILLDEFQDTSEAQLVLLRSLFVAPDEPTAVTAVGDPNQSIYGWRGASATTLARFPQEFADRTGPARVLALSTSWRNDAAILAVANATSTPLRSGQVGELHARPQARPGRVEVARLRTVEDEAEAVAGWVAARWRSPSGRRTGASAAVLCRKRSQFPVVIDALKAQGLAVEVVGLGGLLVTPEVSDIVCLLWVVQDPSRGDRLMRLLTGPICRLGPADLDGLAAWARHRQRARAGPSPAGSAAGPARDYAPESAEQASIVEALDDLPLAAWHGRSGERVSETALVRLRGLARTVGSLRRLTGLPLAELAGEAERALGLDIEVMARPEHTPATARAHLDAFADVAAAFSGQSDRPTLGGFLAWLDAAVERERGLDAPTIDSTMDAVQVLTVHAAKGLEWDVVAIPGLVSGSFPAREGGAVSTWDTGARQWGVPLHRDKGWAIGADGVPFDLRGDREGLPVFRWRTAPHWQALKEEFEAFALDGGRHSEAEERRLMYVGVTRARRDLLLTAPVWSDSKTPKVTSHFLTELVDDRTVPLVTTLDWVPMPEPVEGENPPNPRLAAPFAAPWPYDPMTRRRIALADAVEAVLERISRADSGADETDLGPELVRDLRLLLAERERGRHEAAPVIDLPTHLSASAVVELARDPAAFAMSLRRPMPTEPAVAARRGTAFHSWIEQHYSRAAMVDLLDLPGSADQNPADEVLLPRMKELFLASDWAERTPMGIETVVETVLAGVAVRGRIDAVFRRPDGGVTIVDWKTGPRPSGREATVRALQLGMYAVAYARLTGLHPSLIEAAFYYAMDGTTVYPDLPTEAQIVALLSAVP